MSSVNHIAVAEICSFWSPRHGYGGGRAAACAPVSRGSFSQKSGGPLECTRARVQTSAERVRVLIWDSGPFGAVL